VAKDSSIFFDVALFATFDVDSKSIVLCCLRFLERKK